MPRSLTISSFTPRFQHPRSLSPQLQGLPMLARIMGSLMALAWLLPQTTMLAHAHPQDSWHRVQPGHWVEMRTRSDVFNEQGESAQSSERSVVSTLMCRSSSSYLLRVQSSIESAGRIVADEPRDLLVNLPDSNELRIDVADAVGEAVVDLQSHSINCHVLREIVEVQGETMIRVRYVNPETYPFVFRRELRRPANGEGPETIVRLTEVLGMNVPMIVVQGLNTCAVIRTTEYHQNGVTTQWEVTSQEVPGELIRRSTVEHDASGKLLRQSATELVARGRKWERIDTQAWNRQPNFPRIYRWGTVEFWGLHQCPLPAQLPR